MKDYNLTKETKEKALKNMIAEGYLSSDSTVEDLISFARSAVEDIDFMVEAKVRDWSI